MDTHFPIKSLIINSSNKEIKPCYDDDFKEGVWYMCISSIIASDLKMGFETPKHIAVTSNFVTGVRHLYHGSGPHSYDQPLAMFLLDLDQTTLHQSYDKTWFRVNNRPDCLRLSLLDAHLDPMSSGQIAPHGNFSFLVLFQRVK